MDCRSEPGRSDTVGPGTARAWFRGVTRSVSLPDRSHVAPDAERAVSPVRTTWLRQVDLTVEADAALVSNDLERARSALSELRDSVAHGRHPLPLVDSLVGFGDAARQADELETAIGYLNDAMAMADRCGYRFGRARALVSLGYVTMQVRSLAEAGDLFEQAELLCRELDERMYLANALTGLGEVQSRLRNDGRAIAALEEALGICESIRAHGGIVNAAQHLGDLHRRRGRFEPAFATLSRALEVAQQSGPWIGVVNAADGLGEVSIGLGDLDGAVRSYARSYEMSDKAGYIRGQAHALNGLGRCAYMERDWANATDFHSRALTRYQELGDLPSSSNALDGLARVAEAMEDWPLAVRCRLAAVDAIEEMRAAQDRHDYQVEYRNRFDAVYSWGMRAALKAKDVAAFVAVFEGIAGRRLAGLVSGVSDSATVGNAQLMSSLTARAHDRPSDGADLRGQPRAERLARLLGRHALRQTLPGIAEKALDDVAAALYRPFDPESAVGLIERVTGRGDVLLVCEIPGNGGEIAWVRTHHRGTAIDLGVVAPQRQALALITALAESGLPADATASHLDPLGDLLPPQAFAVDGDTRDALLTIVPLGSLWAVPWSALRVDDREVLGERFALGVVPSVSIADHLANGRIALPTTVAHWRSPKIIHHTIQAFVDDRRITSEALSALTTARHDLVVVAGHGRPIKGIGHYLELDHDIQLEPAAFLNANTPKQLVLLACWGANTPGRPASDPLTLATLALTSGTTHVAATVSELADDPIATRFVNNFLHRLPAQPMPIALRDETRRHLSRESNRIGLLARWAPLITLGNAEGASP